MTILQLLAAESAGLSQPLMHTAGSSGIDAIDAAVRVLDRPSPESGALPLQELIERLATPGFEWGVSDAN